MQIAGEREKMASNKTQGKRLDVALSRLHLDPENPRHKPIEDEAKIIAQLFKSERVMSMAKDIAKKGGISPLETMGAIELEDNPGHYVVLEGNRRTAALKVLKDPKKAPTSAAKSALEALSATLPTKFSIVVFKDRESARQWLELRHLGQQDGVGTRPWDTTQKARFAKGASPDNLAVAILDRAEAAEWINSGIRAKIPVTTLTRYLSNPVVRAALGLGHRGELLFTHHPDEVDAALKRFVLDAAPRSDPDALPPVNSRSDQKARVAYAGSLQADGVSPRTPLPAPVAPPPALPTAAGTKKRGPRHPSDRPTVIPADFIVTHSDKALRRLVAELRRAKPDENFEYAANYLLRAVLERVMVLFSKKHGVYQPKMADNLLVKVCMEKLEADGCTHGQLKNMRIAHSSKDHATSLDTLGAAVHAAHFPTRKGLIAVWDNWEEACKLMLDRL